MRTSAPGNRKGFVAGAATFARPWRTLGFTLLELLVVLAVMGLATGGVLLALRDTPGQTLEREAQRLSAVLAAAQAQARVQGVAVTWQVQGQGFATDGRFEPWLQPGTIARVLQPPAPSGALANRLVLGPDPLNPPTTVALTLADQTLWLQTDGLRPFRVHTPEESARP
jgi:general secretion pathway protein H